MIEVLKTSIIIAWKNIKVEYRNSLLGFLWSFIHPLGLLAVFALVFSAILNLNLREYGAYLLVGLTVWRTIAHCTTQVMSSIRQQRALINSTPIHMLSIPIGNALSSLFHSIGDLAALLLVGVALLGIRLSLESTLILPVLILTHLFTLGIAMVLASLYAEYDDIGYLTDIYLNLLFFSVPVVYPLESVSPPLKRIVMINPYTHLLSMARSAVLEASPPPASSLAYVLAAIAASLMAGYAVFKLREERYYIG